MERLEELGRENLAGIVAAIDELGIDARYEPVGVLDVATREHEVADLEEHAEELRRFGHEAEWLDGEAVRAEIDSPTYLGGVWQKTGVGILDPARLAWGLAAAAESLGARIHEATPVLGLERGRRRRLAAHPGWRVRARRAVLATIRVPAARSVDPPLRRPGLRLRARDRAALGGAARRRRAGRTARARPTPATSSTTTG